MHAIRLARPIRLRRNPSYAHAQQRVWLTVWNECFESVPPYLVGLGRWARWVNAVQGV